MLEKLEYAFNIIQDMDMKPTPHNVRIMGEVYQALREIYAELEEKQNAENRTAADPGRQDED